MAASNPMRDRIKHVVVVMLENRGFDSVLGYLYRQGDEPRRHVPASAGSEPAFDGLDFVADKEKLINTLEWKGKTYLKAGPGPGVRATNSPGWDPHEEFEHVTAQIYGAGGKPPEAPEICDGENCDGGGDPYTKGFLQDYGSLWTVSWNDAALEDIKQIMHVYTPADLPVLSALAKGYAVSDRWFSSAPTQTNANRAC